MPFIEISYYKIKFIFSLYNIMSTNYSVLFKQESAHEDDIWNCAWAKNEHHGNEFIVTGSLDNKVKCWNWIDEQLELKWVFEGHQLGLVSVFVNSSGTQVVSSSMDSQICIWDLESGKQLRSIDNGTVDTWTTTFSPDENYIATGGQSGKVVLLRAHDGSKAREIETKGKFILNIAYSPDGKYIAVSAIDGNIKLIDVETGQQMPEFGHSMPVRSLSFSPDSNKLISASDDGQVKLFDVRTTKPIYTFSGHSGWVTDCDYCPDNVHFATSSTDKTVRVWDESLQQCVNVFHEHKDQVWSCCYNSNGSKIVSVADDKIINVYDCPI